MAGNNHGGEGLGDDFFEQMLSVPGFGAGGGTSGAGAGDGIGFGLGVGGSGGGASDHHQHQQQQLHGSMLGLGTGDGYRGMGIPLGLNLDPSAGGGSFLKAEDLSADANNASSSSSRLLDGDSLHLASLFPAFAHMQAQPLRAPPPHQVQLQQQPFQSQAAPPSSMNPPNIRPRVRARRGQATDPHSIAERQRRERIAERMKALQELVPSCNKTDRAAMLDEIVDYVKFLRLQVKVLSMSRLGGAGAVAQLVADVPPPTPEGGEGSMEGGQAIWERWSNDGTEQQVAKLMEEDIGSAMQFLQSKELCIMPMTLASALFRAHPPDAMNMMKPQTNNPHVAFVAILCYLSRTDPKSWKLLEEDGDDLKRKTC
ncbi:uncharacterized protein [Phyllobates terribilis]|uniref:uncharacterized protein n=1 Tax=Phyllobates terribilis TaxID=111132 RepID=UPI003CCAE23C